MTSGVSQIEGSSGAGLSTWATISGYGTEDSWGASTFVTKATLTDYDFTATGAAIGLRDRIELSVSKHKFDTGDTGTRLGLGEGYTFEQDVYGAKLRLIGDAVYGQNSWLPQIAVGVQHKSADDAPLLSALGAQDHEGTDYYISATKVFLAKSLILSGTARSTRANHFGLLGHGGDQDNRSVQFEGSAAYMMTHNLVLGADYRTKPDNLSFADEGDAHAAYLAWFPTKTLSLTAAYLDLGPIALQGGQNGLYGSVQVAF